MKLFLNVITSLIILTSSVSAETLTILAPFGRPDSLQESAYLAQRVAAGELPPVEQRLPDEPALFTGSDTSSLGQPGGSITTLVTRTKDTRLMVVFGYARLVGYDLDRNIVPDILKSYDVEDGRIFTLHLRAGHRWSDGEPFTSDDFRYYWEDVANNEELSPSGPPPQLLVDGEAPIVEFPDALTVRYTWSKPNPFFLPALAAATPLYIYRPAHYLSQFHANYVDQETLEERAEEAGKDSWSSLHNKEDNLYKNDNVNLPSLQPWIITNPDSDSRFISARNPYFHRVDSNGVQLPYLDEVIMPVVSAQLVSAKTGAGEADLQARGLSLSDYPYLREGEERNGFHVFLWDTASASQFALYPNLNVTDPVWRELLRDVRFRRALSLGINRDDINKVIYFGLARPTNQSVLPQSSLYNADWASAYASLDIAEANRLLDEIGLTQRDGEGYRLMPDGRKLEIVVETAGENPEEVDILELIVENWREIGVKLHINPSQREVLRNRVFTGDTVMSMFFGYDNGVPTPDMSPNEFVPISQQLLQWPKWGQYYETQGDAGEAVDMPLPEELLGLYDTWREATTTDQRRAVWNRILEIHADQVYTIGLVAGVPQPVVVTNRLNNVPEHGLFSWEPGAQFGIYRMDTFWLSPE